MAHVVFFPTCHQPQARHLYAWAVPPRRSASLWAAFRPFLSFRQQQRLSRDAFDLGTAQPSCPAAASSSAATRRASSGESLASSTPPASSRTESPSRVAVTGSPPGTTAR